MEKQRLSASALLLSFSLLISKCFGFFKELLVAKYFGTSGAVDAYVAARGTIEAISGLLTAGVGVALVPVFTEFLTSNKKKEGWFFVSRAFKIFILFLVFLSCSGIMFSPLIVGMLLKGFPLETADLTIVCLRGLFLYFIFVELGAFLQSVHQACKMFTTIILWQMVPNLVMIFFIISFSQKLGIYSVVWGFLLTGILYFLFFYPPFLRRYRDAVQGAVAGDEKSINEGLVKMSRMIVPMMVGQSFGYVVFFVDRFLASYLTEGSIASLGYAKGMMLLPQSLMTFPVTMILYPVFSYAANTNGERFEDIVFRSLRYIFFILLFPTLLFLVSALPVVRLLYERGAFHPDDTMRVAALLKIFSPYFLFSGLSMVLIQAFYAHQDTKTPVRVTFVFSFFSVILSILFVKPLGVRGLALSATISIFINFVLLLALFCRKFQTKAPFIDKMTCLKMACVSIITAVLLWKAMGVFETPYFQSSLEKRIFSVVTLGWVSFIAYIASSYLLGVKVLRNLWADVIQPSLRKVLRNFKEE